MMLQSQERHLTTVLNKNPIKMRILFLALFISTGLTSFAQNDEVLMTIDDKPVYKS